MNNKDLSKLTEKRIQTLTAVELEFSMDNLKDYPIYLDTLLTAIHSQDNERIGAALNMYLYVFNQDDIEVDGL